MAGESAPNGMWACAACTFQNGDDAGACDVCGQMRPVGVVLERQLEDLRAAREKARRRLARVKEGDNVLGPVMESFGCDNGGRARPTRADGHCGVYAFKNVYSLGEVRLQEVRRFAARELANNHERVGQLEGILGDSSDVGEALSGMAGTMHPVRFTTSLASDSLLRVKAGDLGFVGATSSGTSTKYNSRRWIFGTGLSDATGLVPDWSFERITAGSFAILDQAWRVRYGAGGKGSLVETSTMLGMTVQDEGVTVLMCPRSEDGHAHLTAEQLRKIDPISKYWTAVVLDGLHLTVHRLDIGVKGNTIADFIKAAIRSGEGRKGKVRILKHCEGRTGHWEYFQARKGAWTVPKEAAGSSSSSSSGSPQRRGSSALGSSGSSASGLGSSASGSGSSGLGSSAASPARGSGQPATATPNRPPSRRDHQTPSKHVDVAGPNGPSASGLAAKRTSRPTTKPIISVTDLLGGSDALDKLVEQTSGGGKTKTGEQTQIFFNAVLAALRRWADTETGSKGDGHDNMRRASKEGCWTDICKKVSGKDYTDIVTAWRAEREKAKRKRTTSLRGEAQKAHIRKQQQTWDETRKGTDKRLASRVASDKNRKGSDKRQASRVTSDKNRKGSDKRQASRVTSDKKRQEDGTKAKQIEKSSTLRTACARCGTFPVLTFNGSFREQDTPLDSSWCYCELIGHRLDPTRNTLVQTRTLAQLETFLTALLTTVTTYECVEELFPARNLVALEALKVDFIAKFPTMEVPDGAKALLKALELTDANLEMWKALGINALTTELTGRGGFNYTSILADMCASLRVDFTVKGLTASQLLTFDEPRHLRVVAASAEMNCAVLYHLLDLQAGRLESALRSVDHAENALSQLGLKGDAAVRTLVYPDAQTRFFSFKDGVGLWAPACVQRRDEK